MPSPTSAPVIPKFAPLDGIDALVAEKLDILAPCALGGTLTEQLASVLTARIVCGAANNQLAHDGVDKFLADRGILYAPDYVVNAGGVIQVADELAGFNFTARLRRHGEDLRHHRAGAPDRGLRRRASLGGRGPPGRAADVRCRPAAGNLARHHGICVGIRGLKRVRLYLYGCW